MNRVFVPVIILALLVLLVAGGTFYRLDETEQAIITQFGDPKGGPIITPGLKMKLPFIQTVRRFDKRILEWDGSPDQIPTLDKRFIRLDTTARWRIVDPLRFLQSVGDERSAQSRLDDLIDSAARDVVSGHLLIQAVRDFERELPQQTREEEVAQAASRAQALETGAANTPALAAPAVTSPTVVTGTASEARLGRGKLTDLMVERARVNLPKLGIELIDIRIKRINYIRKVQQEVFKRMISERQRIAARFRSEGDGASAEIQGETERELDTISSVAYRQAQEIIGKADATAAAIYAEAFSQDPEFYSFIQTLDTYKQTLQQNSSLMLTTESDFYRYLKNIAGDGTPSQ
ncbi:Modulator of FtsH protease HflC [Candidatus Entotheonellaceae bacterium PAL068K]